MEIIASYLSKFPLGLFIFLLNLPFLVVGYKQIGKTFVVSTLFSLASLSAWVSVFHPIPGLTNDVLLATVFGGIILGIGVGLIIRYGGSTDGTEIISGHLKTVLYSVVTWLEVAKLKSVIMEIDENAFVTINDVSDVMGGKHKKRAIH